MSVLNVLDTTSEWIRYRLYCRQNWCCTGMLLVLLRNSSMRVLLLPWQQAKQFLSCGKSKNVSVHAATNANGSVFSVGGAGVGSGAGGRHTFAVGDYIQTVDGGDTDGFGSDFESAASGGKKVTAVTDLTITTDIDASGAGAAYSLSDADIIANTVPQIQRTVKLTAGSANVIVEQVQIVGG